MNKTALVYFTLMSIIIFFSSCERFEAPTRDKFLGPYRVEFICDDEEETYDINILEYGSNPNEVAVVNLFNSDELLTVRASVMDNTITFSNQELLGLAFNGTGTLNNDILTITVTGADDMGIISTCTITGEQF